MLRGIVVRGSEGKAYETGPALFKVGGRDTDGRIDFMIMDLEFHTGPKLHVHERQEDTFYILSGVLTIQMGEEVYDLEPGDFATVPPGLPHTFDNLREDQGPVRVINIMTPGGYEELFGEFDELPEGAGQEEIEAIYAKYEAKLVGPALHERLRRA